MQRDMSHQLRSGTLNSSKKLLFYRRGNLQNFVTSSTKRGKKIKKKSVNGNSLAHSGEREKKVEF